MEGTCDENCANGIPNPCSQECEQKINNYISTCGDDDPITNELIVRLSNSECNIQSPDSDLGMEVNIDAPIQCGSNESATDITRTCCGEGCSVEGNCDENCANGIPNPCSQECEQKINNYISTCGDGDPITIVLQSLLSNSDCTIQSSGSGH